jgi:hypothetical protein
LDYGSRPKVIVHNLRWGNENTAPFGVRPLNRFGVELPGKPSPCGHFLPATVSGRQNRWNSLKNSFALGALPVHDWFEISASGISA